jgi:hypothetical protein
MTPTSLNLGRFIDFLIPISGAEVFEDEGSAQYRAAEYIANVDDFTSELTELEELDERYAAITLYYATGGDLWNQCFLGDTVCAAPWLTGGVCDWEFVSCNVGGRVTSINLGKLCICPCVCL